MGPSTTSRRWSSNLFTTCRQRLKMEDWRNTQFLCLNQLGINPQVLTPTPLSCEQHPIPPIEQTFPYPNSHHTRLQENVTIPAKRPFASNPCLLSPSGIPDLHNGSVQDGIENGGAGLVVRSQDDLVNEWSAPTGTHSSCFQAVKAALKEVIQWLLSISSWASAIIICDFK